MRARTTASIPRRRRRAGCRERVNTTAFILVTPSEGQRVPAEANSLIWSMLSLPTNVGPVRTGACDSRQGCRWPGGQMPPEAAFGFGAGTSAPAGRPERRRRQPASRPVMTITVVIQRGSQNRRRCSGLPPIQSSQQGLAAVALPFVPSAPAFAAPPCGSDFVVPGGGSGRGADPATAGRAGSR